MTRALILATGVLFAVQQPARDANVRPSTAPAGTASLVGTVVSATGNESVRRARVTLNSTDGVIGRTETTDDAGRFAFRALPAGRYKLSATKPAWLVTNYGATRPERPGTPIAIADGQRLTDVTLRMTHGAAITGIVRNEKGQPMPGVRIEAGRIAMTAGQRTWAGVAGPSAPVETDDSGAYRYYGLPPGEFVIMASILAYRNITPGAMSDFQQLTSQDVSRAQQMLAAAPVPPAASTPAQPLGPRVKPAMVFYPGATDPASAVPISVGPGEERTGVDFTMRLVPTSRIEGVVMDLAGVPLQQATVIATSGGMQLGMFGGTNGLSMVSTDSAGHYQLTGLPPGDYTIVGGGADDSSFTTDVVLSGQDITLPLTAMPPVTISGRVVFEGAPAPAAPSLAYALKATGPLASIFELGAGSQPIANGAFTRKVVPGRYQMQFSGLPAGWYPKSAKSNDVETLDWPIDIGPNSPPVELLVTLTNSPSELTGSLVDAGGRPATEFFVVVYPAHPGERQWARRIMQTRPASDGTFSFKNLPAGNYLVAALTDIEPGESLTPELLESVASLAAPVSIRDGQKTTLPLKIGG